MTKEKNIMENCGDNRFEIIQKAKDDLRQSTNIDGSPDEMKVLDSFFAYGMANGLAGQVR